MFTGTENRVFSRVGGELTVRYSPQGTDSEFCTTTKNISGGGMRMTLLKRLKPGTLLDMEIFKYNNDMMARCRGKIVWVWDTPMDEENEQHFEAGIKFLDQQLLSIGRLINHLETQNTGVIS